MNFFGHNIEFEHPEIFAWSWVGVLGMVLACVLGWWLMRSLRNAYADPENLKRTTREVSFFGFLVKTIGWSLVAFLVAVALAEPFEKNVDVTVPEGSLHVVTIFDVSNSMAAEDYRFVLPTKDGGPPIGPHGARLQMAKIVFTEQVFKAIPGNKIGMVTFTGEGYPQAPLCEDYGTLRFILNHWMGLLSAPGDGSDYVQGMKVALETLRRDFDPSKNNVILLFSDGGKPDFKSGEIDQGKWTEEFNKMVAEVNALRAQSNGKLKVVVVGMGSHTEQMIPLYDPRTWERAGWWPQGEPPAKTKLDEEALKQLATATGGDYLWLNTDGSAQINKDWASVLGGNKTLKGKNPMDWYAIAAAASLFALLIMRGLFRRTDQLPRPTVIRPSR